MTTSPNDKSKLEFQRNKRRLELRAAGERRRRKERNLAKAAEEAKKTEEQKRQDRARLEELQQASKIEHILVRQRRNESAKSKTLEEKREERQRWGQMQKQAVSESKRNTENLETAEATGVPDSTMTARKKDKSIQQHDCQDMEDSPSKTEGSRWAQHSVTKSTGSDGDKDESTQSAISNSATVVALKLPKKIAAPQAPVLLNAAAEKSVEELESAKVDALTAPVEDTMEYIMELPAITNMTSGNHGNEGLGEFFSKAFDNGGDDAITADFDSTQSSVVLTMKFPKKMFTTPIIAAMKLSKKQTAPNTETWKGKASKNSLLDQAMQVASDDEEDDIIII